MAQHTVIRICFVKKNIIFAYLFNNFPKSNHHTYVPNKLRSNICLIYRIMVYWKYHRISKFSSRVQSSLKNRLLEIIIYTDLHVHYHALSMTFSLDYIEICERILKLSICLIYLNVSKLFSSLVQHSYFSC